MKRNIAIIVPCLTRGGAERAAGLLSLYLSEKYNVYIFVLNNEPITYDYSGKLINLHFREEYERLRNKKCIGRIIAKLAYIKAILEIRRLKIEYRISTSISFLETLNIMNILSRSNDKIIVSVRNQRSLQNLSRIQKVENLGIRLLYNKADSVVSLSYGVTDDLIRKFGINKNKVSTIYNFFDIEEIRRKSNVTIPDDLGSVFQNKKVICTMGRLTQQKNYLDLLEQLAPILRKNENVVLIIMGKGDLESDIKAAIKHHKIENSVILLGYCKNPFPVIKNSYVFVMNSVFEGFCNSIVEALACGVPVISTDCLSGPREIIAEKKEYESKISKYTVYDKGILVPLDHTNQMRKAVEFLLVNRNLQNEMTKSAKTYIESLNASELLKAWISVIE